MRLRKLIWFRGGNVTKEKKEGGLGVKKDQESEYFFYYEALLGACYQEKELVGESECLGNSITMVNPLFP